MGKASDSPSALGKDGLELQSAVLRPRGYQLEMLEASLKQNIIVAMDTGSGKTQIAVLRIKAELESCASHKLIWFLAPTVALCFQQHDVIKTQIPNVSSRTLTGLDNVDRWTEQSVWEKVLKDVRVVVSTHAVLADALVHGFVRMSQLALLVFDEAHHCMRRHPANKIMQLHYHPLREQFGPGAVPSVLGLTASPIVRSKKEELQLIESNLDAVCKTPRVNRTELLECIHRPQLTRVSYNPTRLDDLDIQSRLLHSLGRCIKLYDINYDPYMKLLRRDPDRLAEAEGIALSGKTFCKEQLDKFRERSFHMYQELGGWATDFFIRESVDQLGKSVEINKDLTGIERSERVYLFELLQSLSVQSSEPESFHISPKLDTLLDFLEQMDRPEFSAIIFAERRAVVGILARMLSIHPKTKDRFQSAPYVGWSSYHNREFSLGDLVSRDMQRDTLSEFRAGRKNLIVATNVLEEGLDVSSCSLVVCFDRPANMKSFVQRRGRARRQQSTYVIMASTDDEKINVQKWQELEKAMIEAYQDDERRRKEARDLESHEESVDKRLFVHSTSACISADESTQHLHHFCSLLPASDNADKRPIFTFEEDKAGLVRATVILPSSVHPAVRRSTGQNWWRTERAAAKEASFLAYKALWQYGLVNDNLLPVTPKTQGEISNAITAPSQGSSVWASGQFDPYVPLARAWISSEHFYQTEITFSVNGVIDHNLTTSMIMPLLVTMPPPITLYWSLERQILVQFSSPKRLKGITPEQISTADQITSLFLKAPSSRGGKSIKEDYVVLFVPNIVPEQLEAWYCAHEGSDLISDLFERDSSLAPLGFIRDSSLYSEARIFIKYVLSDSTKKNLSIECQSLPPRRNLLNRATMYYESKIDGPPALAPKVQVIPASGCTSSKMPASTGILGRFFSAILDRLEATLVAQELANTLLKGVGFEDLGHILTAITMPIAQARTDYQLYEFFGDSILKFTVACQLFYANPSWQESRLSSERDKFISNANLSRIALLAGLDAYILANRFTPTNWSAPSIEEKLSCETPKRQIANKVIADVVEALIGAAYMDGGMSKAQTCLYRFMPDIDIMQGAMPSATSCTAQNVSSKGCPSSSSLVSLLGYTFNDPSLMTEALTHASGSHDGSQSYNRLEYLGDAVLDMIVVSTLASLPQKISQGQMTLLKHAVTNGNLLAFLCMRLYVEEHETCTELESTHDLKRIHLYDFLRYNGDITAKARAASIKRFETYREETTSALETGNAYPWLPLAQMHADKFFCDIVESTIGAIFVDSRGDMEICTAFAERVGVLPILRRFIQDDVDVQHPRNKAQEILKEERVAEFKITGSLNSYTCTARYGPKKGPLETIEVVSGVAFRDEAEIRAAYLAIPTLYLKEAENGEKDEQTRLERVAHRQQQTKLKKKRKQEQKMKVQEATKKMQGEIQQV